MTREMSFFDHLEELRWCLIKAISAILVFSIAAFFAKEFIWHDIILAPARPDFISYKVLCKLGLLINQNSWCIEKLNFILQSRNMSGQFTMHLTGSFIIGFILAFPYVFYQIWIFIKPALSNKEVMITQGIIWVVSILFLTGVLFGYYLMSPLTINFLGGYQIDPEIVNQFDIISYVSTLSLIILSCGIIFELPVIIFILAKMGITTPGFLRHYRRHSFVIILIIAAIISPGPDVFSQLIMALPLVVLYEVSIWVAAWVENRKTVKLG
ncbi:MAG: twin arginine-targeting protein translocase TatC [Bacteroidetes bacterium RIFCSPLOWO2_02_FULL_36_8]|nr:MAG: twin arginine-targeting protein translocase TatC [Bacteroidetes bacterium RIFCSPLOWO2_02_FULL_36_8]OFY69653.1 MAG: twin arginine-targeting protein translocase TatC [Bacteroidetes bacterium RIFCSPLOWO2_12_FULL_37_12]